MKYRDTAAWKYRLVSFLIYWFARLTAATVRMRVVGEDRVRALQEAGQGVILVTWHGRTLLPITRFRGWGYWALISTSRDGEYQNRIFQRFGFRTVRGSTSARGAVQAALTMTRHLKAGATLAFTPDGPRGPHHEVKPGAVFMAQKSGAAIVPVGVSAFPRRLARSWDQYLIPAPFARAVWIYGDPIYIPANATAQEQQEWAVRLGAAISALEEQAEQELQAACASARAGHR